MMVGALQMNVKKNDKTANLDTVERLIEGPVDLVVMPELFSTGYFFNSRSDFQDIAEEIPNGYTTQRLIKISKKLNCHLIGAIVEKEKGNLYISAVVTGPEGYIGKHRKRHLTIDETEVYTGGNQTEVFEINGCKVGVVICFEGWFPESCRELMLKGAQIICHTVLTCQQRTLDIMRVRAIENKAWLVLANSIATEEYNNMPLTFRGDSRVIDFNGNILTDAGQEEKLVTAEIDEKETINKDLEDCRDIKKEVMKHRYFL